MNVSRTVAWFLKTGIFLLIAGASLGAMMHHQQNLALMSAHAHVTLGGGLVSIVYALCYQQFAVLTRSRLAAAHLVLHFGSMAVLLFLVTLFSLQGRSFDDPLPHTMVGVIGSAGLLLFCSMLAFAANVFRSLQGQVAQASNRAGPTMRMSRLARLLILVALLVVLLAAVLPAPPASDAPPPSHAAGKP